MPQSKAHIKSTNEWIRKNFYRFNLRIPWSVEPELRATAAEFGEGIDEFINKAIIERLERLAQEKKQH
jgi:hypothetical protein